MKWLTLAVPLLLLACDWGTTRGSGTCGVIAGRLCHQTNYTELQKCTSKVWEACMYDDNWNENFTEMAELRE